MKATRVGTQSPILSGAVGYGDLIWVSGQVADNRKGTVYEQTKETLAKIDALLAELGSDKSKLLNASIWLPDMRGFDEMNKAWTEWVDPTNKPSRATVGAPLAHPDIRVEIAVVAHK